MSFLQSLFGGQNFPQFDPGGGGVTTDQSNTGLWDLLQGLVGQANLFGTAGEGHSTMATQGAGGARMGATKALAGMSDANTEAQYKQYQTDIQNQITAQNQSNQTLDNFAQALGFGGSTGGTAVAGADSTGIDAALTDAFGA